MHKVVNIFIQARMSSNRYPGKVLAPVNGKPLIKHLIDRCRQADLVNDIVVLTSNQESDDPLAAYLESIDCKYYRGELDNVLQRFQSALAFFPCDYFVRLCADSPFVDIDLMNFMIAKCYQVKDYDLISNVFERRFPKGQSIEIVKSKLFLSIESEALSDSYQEHVTPYLYDTVEKSNCYNVKLIENMSDRSYCIDSIEDMRKVIAQEKFSFNQIAVEEI